MRTTLLALATFSTLAIPTDAEAMWSWLRGGKGAGEKQGTEMAPLSSSVPRQQQLDSLGGANVTSPSPVLQRTISTGDSERAPHSQSPGSVGSQPLSIPRSAPGTPTFSRRTTAEEREHPSGTLAPGIVLPNTAFTADEFTLFPMDNDDGQGSILLMRPQSAPLAVPERIGQNNGHQEEVFDLEELDTEGSSSAEEGSHAETPEHRSSSPVGDIASAIAALRASSQSGNGEDLVGSAPDRTPKFRRRGAE